MIVAEEIVAKGLWLKSGCIRVYRVFPDGRQYERELVIRTRVHLTSGKNGFIIVARKTLEARTVSSGS